MTPAHRSPAVTRTALLTRLGLAAILAVPATAQDGGSTFSHARTRELAALGVLPTAREVVVRDLVNYHRHRLPLPRADQDVALDLRFDRPTAGAGDEVWLQVGYTTTPLGDRALAAPCRVALVVDCSGSMAEAGKMTAVQAGLRAFVDRLRADDEVALVTFATEGRLVERVRARGDGRWLHDAIERLTPGGNTNLHDGLRLGLDELGRRELGPRSQRLIVLTDGIANTGLTAPDQILAEVTRREGKAIDISTIGVGQHLDVPLLQRLADGSRGLFHFVADGGDVQKVFVDEAEALLAAVARQVRLRIELPGHGLQAVQVLHEGATSVGQHWLLDLPDLNAGATGVVMLRARVAPGARGALIARAELAFTDARHERAAQVTATATLGEPRGAARDEVPGCDLEVRKNAAIAVLGQGLADLAVASDARRWADADRALRLARDHAQQLFPGQDDDVQRMRDLAAGHAATVRRYVDRFREL
jgi:Ca-activated chloride channel family protein